MTQEKLSTMNSAGVWPVMLTPFEQNMEIDWRSLEKLIDWYIAAGVHGLFAVCQSSEMFFLSDKEAAQLTRFIVDYTDGRVPVVASGHTGNSLSHQVDQLSAIAATGVDSVILISNRLCAVDESNEVFQSRLQELLGQLPEKHGLGIYECPYPYKRLLTDEVIAWCAKSGRFDFLKDTCCNLDTLRRRAEIVKGSSMRIANANAQTLLESMKAGCHGYSGVMANFHPALYVWLVENWKKHPEEAEILSRYLSVSALSESMDYPVCAKDYHKAIGNFASVVCRSRPSGGFYQNHYQTTVEQMMHLGEKMSDFLHLDHLAGTQPGMPAPLWANR